ncbi:MAG: ribosomal protein S18-alanine N-acetyltransferase [Candidatus Alcyoniella australis]|nr:ribosomal protein S18-alanine N-acetyltransferase [Candidatus Alcyoniella australis]
MQVLIQPASVRWIDQIWSIESESFAATWSREALAALLADPRAVFLVALVSDQQAQLAGYALCWEVVDELHMLKIAGSPRFRRQGIGRQMVQQLIQRARRSNMRVIQLEVRANNDTALGFYRALGFVQAGLRPGYYTDSGEDAVLLDFQMGGGA